MALISTVASVSLALLPRLLTQVKTIIVSHTSSEEDPAKDDAREMRDELVEALFKMISQDVGDAEKGFAIDWWYKHRDALVTITPSRDPAFDGREAVAPTLPNAVSRL